ncbi:hypothetical protein [Stenotrophomonas oahuensis]|uniref:Secreted protein n=1 Tax=Stenotrophomonas oahuensis TaxID=3003271 RepID=A0ABY9YM47_9GAMM|nr:hypothetical protein [Stenotrophomonas sp. A5586]WNH51972.1 hypothetical protein PDM29_16745 [Stenotrophomonas sp. A5586]
MKTLFTLCLLASAALTGTAMAQTPAPAAAGSDCITLSDDQQLVRRGADNTILLRNGSDHYIVHFTHSCSSARVSRKLDFVTRGNEGQLCGARASKLRTDKDSCDVASLEPITAEAFATRARR